MKIPNVREIKLHPLGCRSCRATSDFSEHPKNPTNERKGFFDLIAYKKGGDRYLSPWMILVWLIVAGSIVAGVILFYSVVFDIQKEEASAIGAKIADCVVENGYLQEDINADNIFERCYISKEGHGSIFFFRVDIKDIQGNIIRKIDPGAGDFEVQCLIKTTVKSENFAQCSSKRVYAVNRTDSRFILDIITGSNNRGGKV